MNVDGRNMATMEGKFKPNRRTTLTIHEFKFHDQWIEEQKGPSVPSKYRVQLYY